MLGPIFACLIAALLRVPMAAFSKVTALMRAVLGVAVGASITPDLMGRIGDMMGSVALVPLFVLTIGIIGVPYFMYICKFDRATSFYAAMPGGLQDMLAFGQEAGGSVRSLSLVHATRVLVLVSILPFLLREIWHLDLTLAPGSPASATPVSQMALMVFSAGFGWWAAARLKMFGAAILGPLIVSAALSLSGILTIRPPAETIMAAQFFLGLGVGVHYVGISGRELRHDVLAALGFCVIIGVLSGAFAAGVAASGLAPPIESILAFSPGGQAEMAVLALVSGSDIAFVVAHHVIRIVVVILSAPLFARFLFRR